VPLQCKKCHYSVKFIGPRNELQPLTEIDKWVKHSQEDCLYCGEFLVVKTYRDAVKDHCHITGKYRGAAHNMQLQLKITSKTENRPNTRCFS